MPIPEGIAGPASRSAQAEARADANCCNVAEITRSIQGKFDPEGQYPVSAWRKLAQDAVDTVQAGSLLEQGAADTLRPWEIGSDPSIPGPSGTYGYRVVVRIDDGTGNVFSTAVTVTSSGELSPDQIRMEAIEAVAAGRTERDYQNRISTIGQPQTVTTTIIGAGIKP